MTSQLGFSLEAPAGPVQYCFRFAAIAFRYGSVS